MILDQEKVEEKIMLLGWVMQLKRKEWRKAKAKVDDKRPGMKLFKGKYIHSTLKLELFHPQVSALMR